MSFLGAREANTFRGSFPGVQVAIDVPVNVDDSAFEAVQQGRSEPARASTAVHQAHHVRVLPHDLGQLLVLELLVTAAVLWAKAVNLPATEVHVVERAALGIRG